MGSEIVSGVTIQEVAEAADVSVATVSLLVERQTSRPVRGD